MTIKCPQMSLDEIDLSFNSISKLMKNDATQCNLQHLYLTDLNLKSNSHELPI